MALSITRRPSRAEDAIQEAFARLWKSEARPRGDAIAYVFAAVRNAAIEGMRRAGPEPMANDYPASIYDGRAVDPAAAAMKAERVETVRHAVEDLPEDQREVVVMRIYAGLKFAQIADVIGRPTPTAVTRYRRALERLRREIGQDHE